MAGGSGVEWYFGSKFPHMDINCEDWRSRDHMWDQTRHALQFFHAYLPFVEMHANNSLTSSTSDFCFAKPGEVYAVYLPDGGTTQLKLPAGAYAVRWYDPRSGGVLQLGTVARMTGPGNRAIGMPPADPQDDWVALVCKPAWLDKHGR